jgi:hypothetical protein
MFKIVTPSGQQYELSQGDTTLGRENCDITLQDEEVSRRHARIERQGNRLILHDLDSTNGTFVNGNRVTGSYHLQPGDQVYLGTTRLQVRQTHGAAPTKAVSPDQIAGLYPPPAPTPPAHASPQGQSPAPSNMAYAQPQQPVYSHPPKSRSTATLLEIGLGLFSFLGFGWIYSGKTGTGITILIVDFLANLFFVLLGALTFGISFVITIPIQIIAIIISTVMLSNYTKKRTDLFGPS